MLIKVGTSRTAAADRHLASVLAAVAGGLNATAFYAVGFFSANMTGNVSVLSDKIVLGEWRSAAFYCSIVLAFIVGSISSTLFINEGRRRGERGIYALIILVEAALLVAIALSAVCLPPDFHAPVMILGLAFLMGLQNAAVTRISDARVRTTHVSGMVTDIGIELALLFDISREKGSLAEKMDVRSRLRLHLETVLSFLVGGIIGLLIYQRGGVLVLWVAAAILSAFGTRTIFMMRDERADENISIPPNDM